ncbi:hypothetical protein [Litoreibacter janthinus]|uniref:Uncharacterized protein n=1 Tax=Litoreibacter janthinus TaxID=670154 RepID=A0A1I6HQS7_9RHOB|nr:hypothetical protein [Litoreibacter janthinus]SFR56812.1 hypothetical protein SAMN04488002_3279 [Litoreibacter janthinus]
MKLIAFTTALALAAAPVLAGSPAEEFDMKNAGSNASAAAYETAVLKLSGDDIDNRIVVIDAPQVSRNSQGHIQLARDLGVSPDTYSTAELARMFIGAHD